MVLGRVRAENLSHQLYSSRLVRLALGSYWCSHGSKRFVIQLPDQEDFIVEETD